MSFQIEALDPTPFRPLFRLPHEKLEELGIESMTVDAEHGFPCRVSLRDAPLGSRVLLLNHEHLPLPGPYRSCHAIFVAADAEQARPQPGDLPDMLRRRLLSLRAFDADQRMIDADVAEGDASIALINRMLERDDVAWIDLHTARRGCFMARARRA